jgi:hypothetical protein
VLVALPVAATTGAATAVVLRETVVRPPDPNTVPDEQTPLAGTAVVSPLRAADPGDGLPWTIRVARSKTGFTCTTVGQVHNHTFGLTGLDGVFRRLPAELSDSCGQGGTLTGARVVDGATLADVRSVVYGVAPGLKAATLTTTSGRAVLRGYPEDSAAGVILTFKGRTEGHSFAAAGIIPDPGGGQAWVVDGFRMGTRYACALLRQARLGVRSAPVSPTACLLLRTSRRLWIADARRFQRGDRGTPGFDRWHWRDTPARVVVWGIARTPKAIKRVVLHGAGAPRELEITQQGAFATLLPASTDPTKLTLDVTLPDGTVQHGRPGEGVGLDPVPSRRPR